MMKCLIILNIFYTFLIHKSYSFILKPQLQSHIFSSSLNGNIYDDWRSDIPVDKIPLDEELVRMCLDEMINSNFGQQMFGVHEKTGKTDTMLKAMADFLIP